MGMPLEAAVGSGAIIATVSFTLAYTFFQPDPEFVVIGEDFPSCVSFLMLFFVFIPALLLFSGSKAARAWLSLTMIGGTAMILETTRHLGIENALATFPAKMAVMMLCGIVALWMPRSNAWFNDPSADAI